MRQSTMAEESSNTRSRRVEEGGQTDQWVRISTAQLTQILRSLDDSRAMLLHLAGGPVAPSSERRKSWWGRHCWPNGRRFLYRNITLITVILQFLNLLILSVIDVFPKHLIQEYKMIIASSATMIALQVLNLFILILASGRLAKQVFHHDVNNFFLAQSYLATLLLFAGLYTLTFRLDRKSWKFLHENLTSNPIQVFKLYFKFLFYSISTATLCGSDSALPVDWYNHLFAGTQMLLSFCYFASILGVAVSPGQASQPKRRESPSRPGTYPRSVSFTAGHSDTYSSFRSLLSDSPNTTGATTPADGTDDVFLQLQHQHQLQQQQQQQQHLFGQRVEKCPNVPDDLETSDQYSIAPHDVLVHLRGSGTRGQQVTHSNYSYNNHGNRYNNHNHDHSNNHRQQQQQNNHMTQQQRQQGRQLSFYPNTWAQSHPTLEDFPRVNRCCSIQNVDERFNSSCDDGVNDNDDDDEPLLIVGCQTLTAKP